MEQVDVIIPAYKPDEKFIKLIEMLRCQTYPVHSIIVMNTEETYYDRLRLQHPEADLFDKVKTVHLTEAEFDHGKTRNEGVKLSAAPYFVMMTDDAVPADDRLIEHLMKALEGRQTAAAYARQICPENADPLERYARSFNYPEESRVKGKEDLGALGIKTYFCSNVCAAYKRDIFDALGGFVCPTIFNEDMIYAANAVEHGYKIAYAAQAKVIHYHKYSYRQQFSRNFDLAVSQADHPEVFAGISSESEGKKLVKNQIAYLVKSGMPLRIPHVIMQSGFKYLGYKMGKAYSRMPLWLVKKCSMNKKYWCHGRRK